MKKIKCIYLFSVVCIFLLYACGSKTDQKKFFDVPGYFKAEIDSIKSNYTTVLKTSVYNGDTNRQELKVVDINWEKEFALFLESNINKPVYYANMSYMESMLCGIPGAKTKTESYEARSKKLSVQCVNIEYEKEEAMKVTINISKSNLISTTKIDAYYKKGISYMIIGRQRINNFGEENQFYLVGEFLR